MVLLVAYVDSFDEFSIIGIKLTHSDSINLHKFIQVANGDGG